MVTRKQEKHISLAILKFSLAKSLNLARKKPGRYLLWQVGIIDSGFHKVVRTKLE
jgi:hypothetical protein